MLKVELNKFCLNQENDKPSDLFISKGQKNLTD